MDEIALHGDPNVQPGWIYVREKNSFFPPKEETRYKITETNCNIHVMEVPLDKPGYLSKSVLDKCKEDIRYLNKDQTFKIIQCLLTKEKEIEFLHHLKRNYEYASKVSYAYGITLCVKFFKYYEISLEEISFILNARFHTGCNYVNPERANDAFGKIHSVSIFYETDFNKSVNMSALSAFTELIDVFRVVNENKQLVSVKANVIKVQTSVKNRSESMCSNQSTSSINSHNRSLVGRLIHSITNLFWSNHENECSKGSTSIQKLVHIYESKENSSLLKTTYKSDYQNPHTAVRDDQFAQRQSGKNCTKIGLDVNSNCAHMSIQCFDEENPNMMENESRQSENKKFRNQSKSSHFANKSCRNQPAIENYWQQENKYFQADDAFIHNSTFNKSCHSVNKHDHNQSVSKSIQPVDKNDRNMSTQLFDKSDRNMSVNKSTQPGGKSDCNQSANKAIKPFDKNDGNQSTQAVDENDHNQSVNKFSQSTYVNDRNQSMNKFTQPVYENFRDLSANKSTQYVEINDRNQSVHKFTQPVNKNGVNMSIQLFDESGRNMSDNKSIHPVDINDRNKSTQSVDINDRNKSTQPVGKSDCKQSVNKSIQPFDKNDRNQSTQVVDETDRNQSVNKFSQSTYVNDRNQSINKFTQPVNKSTQSVKVNDRNQSIDKLTQPVDKNDRNQPPNKSSELVNINDCNQLENKPFEFVEVLDLTRSEIKPIQSEDKRNYNQPQGEYISCVERKTEPEKKSCETADENDCNRSQQNATHFDTSQSAMKSTHCDIVEVVNPLKKQVILPETKKLKTSPESGTKSHSTPFEANCKESSTEGGNTSNKESDPETVSTLTSKKKARPKKNEITKTEKTIRGSANNNNDVKVLKKKELQIPSLKRSEHGHTHLHFNCLENNEVLNKKILLLFGSHEPGQLSLLNLLWKCSQNDQSELEVDPVINIFSKVDKVNFYHFGSTVADVKELIVICTPSLSSSTLESLKQLLSNGAFSINALGFVANSSSETLTSEERNFFRFIRSSFGEVSSNNLMTFLTFCDVSRNFPVLDEMKNLSIKSKCSLELSCAEEDLSETINELNRALVIRDLKKAKKIFKTLKDMPTLSMKSLKVAQEKSFVTAHIAVTSRRFLDELEQYVAMIQSGKDFKEKVSSIWRLAKQVLGMEGKQCFETNLLEFVGKSLVNLPSDLNITKKRDFLSKCFLILVFNSPDRNITLSITILLEYYSALYSILCPSPKISDAPDHASAIIKDNEVAMFCNGCKDIHLCQRDYRDENRLTIGCNTCRCSGDSHTLWTFKNSITVFCLFSKVASLAFKEAFEGLSKLPLKMDFALFIVCLSDAFPEYNFFLKEIHLASK